jgi:hypothetical protein
MTGPPFSHVKQGPAATCSMCSSTARPLHGCSSPTTQYMSMFSTLSSWVAYLIADGHTDRSAAKALDVSVNTVSTQTRSAYTKLGVRSRVHRSWQSSIRSDPCWRFWNSARRVVRGPKVQVGVGN